MNNDLVSIIMPCHNGALYLKESIESVQKQTWENWELLIIDDASTDNSCQIVEEYMCNDSRINLFHNEHSTGIPATPRNIGIKAAKGRYIAFIDCDDAWVPNKLQSQLPLFEKEHVGVVFSNCLKMTSEGVPMNRLIKFPMVVDYSMLLKGCCIGNIVAVYDSAKVGKVYQKEVHQEDYLMWLNIMSTGVCAMNTNTIGAFYRIHKDSLSGNKLKTIGWQWNILRCELKFSFFKAFYYFFSYAVKGLLKFLA